MTTRETGAATQAQDDVCRLADLYCETKDRIVDLLDDSDAAQWNRPVPACPGWSVRDVVAHLTAVALDLLDGRLTIPPSDAETAEHVCRFDGCGEDELFSIWAGAADRLVQSAATAEPHSEGRVPATPSRFTGPLANCWPCCSRPCRFG